MKYILSAIYSLILIIAGLIILQKRYADKDKNQLIKEVIKSNKVYCICSGILFLIITFILYRMNYMNSEVVLEVIIKWFTIIFGCFVIAFIDFKEHIIPNKIILGLFIFRIAFMLYEAIKQPEFLNYFVWYPIIGAVVGGVMMIIGMIISRKGLGMGDVKLFFIIGFYVSSYSVIPTMIYTFLICACVGILLLVLKKVSIHDALPLAPFAFCGVLIQFALVMMGG